GFLGRFDLRAALVSQDADQAAHGVLLRRLCFDSARFSSPRPASGTAETGQEIRSPGHFRLASWRRLINEWSCSERSVSPWSLQTPSLISPPTSAASWARAEAAFTPATSSRQKPGPRRRPTPLPPLPGRPPRRSTKPTGGWTRNFPGSPQLLLHARIA